MKPFISFLFLLAACSPNAEAVDVTSDNAAVEVAQPVTPPADAPQLYTVEIINTYPHDVNAFTQGLFFADGSLFESTGKKGASVIRRVNLDDGAVLQQTKLADDIFGEGSTLVDDRIISLSWREGIGFVFDRESLTLLSQFPLAGEGWGLTYDGTRLILSDGTSKLRLLDPVTFEEIGSIPVTYSGKPVYALNELEWIEGEVWANIWQRDVIVRIDPATGVVTGVINVANLMPVNQRISPTDDVPNGIAYDDSTGRLFLTGKRWDKVFEVKLVAFEP